MDLFKQPAAKRLKRHSSPPLSPSSSSSKDASSLSASTLTSEERLKMEFNKALAKSKRNLKRCSDVVSKSTSKGYNVFLFLYLSFFSPSKNNSVTFERNLGENFLPGQVLDFFFLFTYSSVVDLGLIWLWWTHYRNKNLVCVECSIRQLIGSFLLCWGCHLKMCISPHSSFTLQYMEQCFSGSWGGGDGSHWPLVSSAATCLSDLTFRLSLSILLCSFYLVLKVYFHACK